METYYVKADEYREFASRMKKTLQQLGLKEQKNLPVDFLFLAGSAGYQRNAINTKQSMWFSKLWGKSHDILTNKIKLHERFKDSDFLIPSVILKKNSELPVLSGKSLYILKPVEGFEGSGITVLKKTIELEEWLSSHPMYTEWIIQPYIRNPGLVDGYKFHLRVLTLVKKEYKKPIEAYVANYKFMMKAKEKYKKEDWLNTRIHDTHFNEPGVVILFPKTIPDDWTESETTRADKKINSIIKTLLEAENDFKPDWNSKNGFELFGVDILFDKKKPYLLEFNKKPGLINDEEMYAGPVAELIVENKVEPYFTRVL